MTTDTASLSGILRPAGLALALGLALVLSGCGQGGDNGGGSVTDGATTSTDLGDRDWGSFGQEGDIVLGDMDAPVSIVEYASTTCGHCAQFDVFTFPFLKQHYIDTGLVRYTMRPLPTPPTNMSRLGFMIARCLPESRYYPFIDALMRTQGQWAFAQDSDTRINSLAQLAAQAGMDRDAFDACRLDQAGLDFLNQQVEQSQQAGVRSTPTFFINGEKLEGAYPWEQFEPYIIAHLPEDLRPTPPEPPADSADDGDGDADSATESDGSE